MDKRLWCMPEPVALVEVHGCELHLSQSWSWSTMRGNHCTFQVGRRWLYILNHSATSEALGDPFNENFEVQYKQNTNLRRVATYLGVSGFPYKSAPVLRESQSSFETPRFLVQWCGLDARGVILLDSIDYGVCRARKQIFCCNFTTLRSRAVGCVFSWKARDLTVSLVFIVRTYRMICSNIY